MKTNVINIMNFARQIDERVENSEEILFNTTKKEIELVKRFGFKNTFLLQYDVLCDQKYIDLFKECDENSEFGLWYEIVEPLTTTIGVPYESDYGWKWDWHVKPGYPMSYSVDIRIKMLDEAMRKFKEVFGYYPKVFASWVIDTPTLLRLTSQYHLDLIAICRDQFNTDAYNLIGGYHPIYYPSINNTFTPGNGETQIDVPIIRLIGPCPIHNYDNGRYSTLMKSVCYTIEPVWNCGSTPQYMDWLFNTLFNKEHIGWTYLHIGQENCFGTRDFLPALKTMLEKIQKLDNVQVLKMSETGRLFKEQYQETPVAASCALNDYEEGNLQSANYNSKRYKINIFRHKNKIFIRFLYLFDDKVKDRYYDKICETFFATYENLPVIDTVHEGRENFGLILDENAEPFDAKYPTDDSLYVYWNNGSITLKPDTIIINKKVIYMHKDNFVIEGNKIAFNYCGNTYSMVIENADIKELKDKISIVAKDEQIIIKFGL